MSCETCKTEKPDVSSAVPRWAHDADMARMERSNKRLWIALLLALAMISTLIFVLVWRESQYVDEVTETIETTSDGGDAYGTIVSGNGGEVYYGYSQDHAD